MNEDLEVSKLGGIGVLGRIWCMRDHRVAHAPRFREQVLIFHLRIPLFAVGWKSVKCLNLNELAAVPRLTSPVA